MIRVASFDIGKKNFAFCIEEFSTTSFNNLSHELTETHNPDGSCTPMFEEFLKNIFKNGKILEHQNINLTVGVQDKKNSVEIGIFLNMKNVLNSFSEILDTCDIILIEEQMSFGKRLNLTAVKLAQHLYSFFLFSNKMTEIPEIVIIPAYQKTQILGLAREKKGMLKSGKGWKYKAVSPYVRKQWAVKKALEICSLRNDKETEKRIQNSRKKDDLSDVICQLQAFKYLRYISGEI